jgi:hypothetical protein
MNSLGDKVKAVLRYRRIVREKNEKFHCMFEFIMKTRKTGAPSVFSFEHFGCPGFRFYSGFSPKLPEFNHYFVATGIPGLVDGERFMPSPASSKRSAGRLEGREPAGRNLVFERIDRSAIFDGPACATNVEAVIFFANAEIISGLVGLVRFAADDDDAVRTIYSSGCASIFSWPVQLRRQGEERAVLGVFDPAARPWLKKGEMTIAMPYQLFRKILAAYKDSFIYKPLKKPPKRGADLILGWKDVLRRAGEIDRGGGGNDAHEGCVHRASSD